MAKKRARPGRSDHRIRRTHADIVHETDAVTVSMNLAETELPSQEYEADVLWPMMRHGAVSFILDRLSLHDPSRVEARVEVRMSYESFLKFWASTQTEHFASKLRTWLAAHPIEAAPETPRRDAEPEQGRAVLRAQVARVSLVGSDADVSFYALPTSHMSVAITDATITTVPIAGVLRVTTTTSALARLLTACAPLAEEITPMIKEGEL